MDVYYALHHGLLAASCAYTCCPLLSYVLHRTPWLLAYAACCCTRYVLRPAVAAAPALLVARPACCLPLAHLVLMVLSPCWWKRVIGLCYRVPPCICTAHCWCPAVARILRLCTLLLLELALVSGRTCGCMGPCCTHLLCYPLCWQRHSLRPSSLSSR